MNYKIRLYNKYGDCIETRYADTLQAAETIRTMHAVLLGLDEKKDFALYPTIWEKTETGYIRILGY